jgi:hypothetical protein
MGKNYMQKQITYQGETHTTREWSAIKGMSWHTIVSRIGKGWSIEKTLETPQNEPRKKPVVVPSTKSEAKQTQEALMAMALKVIKSNPRGFQRKMKELADKDFLNFIKLIAPFLPRERDKTEEIRIQPMSFIAEPITNPEQIEGLKPL